MSLQLSRLLQQRRKYLRRPLIKVLCKCGCNEIFETRVKESQFMNGVHYWQWRKNQGISKPKYKRNTKWKFQKKPSSQPSFWVDLNEA